AVGSRMTRLQLQEAELAPDLAVHIQILNVESGAEVRKIPVPASGLGGGAGGPIPKVRFSRDGELLAGFLRDYDDAPWLWIWNVATGVKTRTLRGHTDSIVDVVPAAAGQHFLSASTDGYV